MKVEVIQVEKAVEKKISLIIVNLLDFDFSKPVRSIEPTVIITSILERHSFEREDYLQEADMGRYEGNFTQCAG